jgi:probable F420-dependent oxidoreductase
MAFCEIEHFAAVARIAEELGFEGVTVAEHQLMPEVLRSFFPYGEGGKPQFGADEAWPEPWTLIASMAAATERLRFCTAVHILPLHHPLSVAKIAATVAVLSGGRVVLGVGAGWMKEEYDAFGIDFHTRGRRLDECLEVLARVWSGEMVEHHGEFFAFDRLVLKPAPPERIPIWVGGNSPGALRRAARIGDGWLAGGEPAEQVIASLATIRALRAELGRDSLPFEALTLHPVGLLHDFDELARLEAAGLTGVIHVPFRFGLGVETSSLAQKRGYLERFAEDVITRLR